MNLKSLSLFLGIVEAGSLSAAARAIGVSTTTVSERLAALEDYYGATLIARSTRSLSLTAEGEVLAEGARRLLLDAQKLESDIRNGAEAGAQVIRFSAPTDLGENQIMPTVDRFLAAHPDVSIDFVMSDENVDVLRDGLDFAIRDGGTDHDALICEHLMDNPRVVVAAPAYLDRMGALDHPNDLIRHHCLTLRVGPHINRFWRFHHDGMMLEAPITPARTSNNARLIADWCRQGHGVAIKSAANVAADLESGRLRQVLADFAPPAGVFNMVYPSDRSLCPLVAQLVTLISTDLNAGDLLKSA